MLSFYSSPFNYVNPRKIRYINVFQNRMTLRWTGISIGKTDSLNWKTCPIKWTERKSRKRHMSEKLQQYGYELFKMRDFRISNKQTNKKKEKEGNNKKSMDTNVDYIHFFLSVMGTLCAVVCCHSIHNSSFLSRSILQTFYSHRTISLLPKLHYRAIVELLTFHFRCIFYIKCDEILLFCYSYSIQLLLKTNQFVCSLIKTKIHSNRGTI